jgi:hypothetical protein
MKILKRVKLHTTAFCGGTNLQMDLSAEKRRGIQLIDDPDSEQILVSYKGDFIEIPYANVVEKTPQDPSILKSLFEKIFANTPDPLLAAHKAAVVSTTIKAQASSPLDHVHAGPGKGKN